MSLSDITDQMKARVGEGGKFKKSVKFDFGSDGIVRIDDKVSPAVVDNSDAPTDCTVKVSMADFVEIAQGKQNAQMAFMMGKLKVEGDMSVAMALQKII
jgi:putative sterol carrier protein